MSRRQVRRQFCPPPLPPLGRAVPLAATAVRNCCRSSRTQPPSETVVRARRTQPLSETVVRVRRTQSLSEAVVRARRTQPLSRPTPRYLMAAVWVFTAKGCVIFAGFRRMDYPRKTLVPLGFVPGGNAFSGLYLLKSTSILPNKALARSYSRRDHSLNNKNGLCYENKAPIRHYFPKSATFSRDKAPKRLYIDVSRKRRAATYIVAADEHSSIVRRIPRRDVGIQWMRASDLLPLRCKLQKNHARPRMVFSAFGRSRLLGLPFRTRGAGTLRPKQH